MAFIPDGKGISQSAQNARAAIGAANKELRGANPCHLSQATTDDDDDNTGPRAKRGKRERQIDVRGALSAALY
jgi:hypothetical protein